jgi:hypothetical protein
MSTDRGTDNWLIKYDVAEFGATEPKQDAKLISIEEDANDADDEEVSASTVNLRVVTHSLWSACLKSTDWLTDSSCQAN